MADQQRDPARHPIVVTSDVFEAFLELTPDAIVIIDAAGTIVVANPQAESLFGFPPQELMGKSIDILVPTRYQEAHARHRALYVGDLQKRPMGADVRLYGVRKDGTEFPVDISLSPLKTDSGLLIAAAVRDLSERMRAAEEVRASEAKFRGLLESAPDAIVIVDQGGIISLVNSQTESLFGYRREDLLGLPVETLLPERFRSEHFRHRETYLVDSRVRPMGAGLNLFGRRRNGAEFPVEISLAPLDKDGNVFAAIRDITQRKKLERVRDEFIRNAAHELRTPMAILVGLGETLAFNHDDLSPEQIEKISEAVLRQGARAKDLVNNLLDLSRLEGGQDGDELSPVDIAPLIQLAADATPAPDGSTVSIHVTPGCTALAHAIRTQQIISNLLTNAYRYGGPKIQIEAINDEKWVVIHVTDDGPGVPAALIDTLFDPFSRGKESRHLGGSGLGLALCKRIVEVSGGSILYESVEPTGARFTVRLPKAR